MSEPGVTVMQLKGISILFSPEAVSDAMYLHSSALPLASRIALAILRILFVYNAATIFIHLSAPQKGVIIGANSNTC